MRIWLNGTLRTEQEAGVSVFDHGLTVGDGVFETVKTVDGAPFALTRHLERLARSAAGLGLPAPDLDELRRACHETVAASPHPLGRLRLTYTGGRGPMGSDRGDTVDPTVLAAHFAIARRPDTTSAVTVAWTRNERGALSGLKTTSYGENVVALAAARARAASEAIFPNTTGALCEGTGTNVFVVLDGVAWTPPLSSGALAGVTRALVLEWTDAREAELPMDALNRAEEVFLTSTTRDVQAVARLDGRDLPGAPGPVTAAAMRVFAERAAADIDP
ncbi:aminotransferase class IV [Streptomyces bohaiensis]|uniref:4-amino-4-deoxychorismate lyase n=1 Tax=Streptomyces bohaiensis TaxID=1431344 RepID=A0ABX1CAH7_9ACTN|nr:aminotransferase class IV [Streptomyces bohaiensis]NJQ16125.1 4-amino-4-deoxychorismate lyase [Streptomyces bohaiensis]